MTKKFTIVFAALALAVFGLAQSASAATSALYVSPASGAKNVGETINISVGVAANGNKVFAAEGALVFDKLTCVSITVADGITSQTSPSCANPKFLLGIPSGTTANKTLFTVVVKAATAGEAKLSVTGVDVIGEGSSLFSAGASATFTVGQVAKPEVVAEPTPAVTPVVTATVVPAKTTKPANKTKVETPAETVANTDEAVTTAAPTEDSAASTDEGKVLGGYEQENTATTGGWSTATKAVVAIVVLIIVFLLGRMSFKKKKV